MSKRLKTRIWRSGSAEIALLNCTGHRFPKHFHDEYVIGVNIVGGESIWLDGKQEDVDQHGITVFNPGEIQSSAPLVDDWAFVSVYFDEEYYTANFGGGVPARFDKPVVRSAAYAGALGAGCLSCLSGDLADQEIHEFIVLACDGLFNRAAVADKKARRRDSATDRVVDMMLADLSTVPSLGQLAESVSMSPVQLARLFKDSTGLPPMAWLRSWKLNRVRGELAGNEKVQYLASKYGFADHPHLTRQFRAMFGYTPSAYQAALA